MKDCIAKLNNISNNGTGSHCLKSILRVNSEYSSSNESLVTLLNASIEHQQARLKWLSQSTMNTFKSNHSSTQLNQDEELEMFARQHTLKKLRDDESEQDDPPKKKKKKKLKDCEGDTLGKSELEVQRVNDVLPKKHKKGKHKHPSISEVEEDGEKNDVSENKQKTKTKEHHKESNLAEMKNLHILKSQKPDISRPVFGEPDTSHKKSKKKRKHSSISEVEDHYEKTVKEISETSSSKEIKRKKKHNSTMAEVEDRGEEEKKKKVKYFSTMEVKDGGEAKKKKKHKHSSTSEVEDSGEEQNKKKHKLSRISEVENSSNEKKEKRQKHSSILEVIVEENGEEKKKKKPKHSSISKVEKSAEEKKKEKHKHPRISEVEDSDKEKMEKRRKHSSLSEVEESGEDKKKGKHKHPRIPEVEDSDKKEMEKRRKHSSILEVIVEENGEEKKKKKPKHSSISKVEKSAEEKKKEKHKHPRISEVEDSDKEKMEKRRKHSSISEVEESGEDKKKGKHKHPRIPEVEDSDKKEMEKRRKHSSITEVDDSGKEKKENKDRVKTESISMDEDSENLQAAASNSKKADKVKSKKKLQKTPSKRNSSLDFSNENFDTNLEKKELNDADMSLLMDLHIVVPWELPKSHTIETRLSHPTSEQYKQLKALDFTMKSGPYNKEEDQKIKDNWEEFCRDHDLEISPLVFFPVEGEGRNVLPTEQRINFVRYLGKGLKNRTLASIYNRFQLLFRPYKKGKFTPEEDNIILKFTENSNVSYKYSALSAILNRGRELIKRRHDVLKTDVEKFSWNMSLLQDLVNNLLKITKKETVEDLKDFSVMMAHWKLIAKEMGIPAVKLRRKWEVHLYPRLFVEQYHTLNEIREKLINTLYENKEDDRKKINWKQLAQSFDGMTGSRLYKIFLDMLRQYVPEKDKANFRDTVICLKGTLPHMLLTQKVLTKLTHRNGQLFDTKKREPL